MADPLSLAASIIAVIGAADSAGKGIVKLASLRGVPDIVLALNNEISELRLMLTELETLLYGPSLTQTSRVHLNSSILPNVLRAKDKLDALQTVTAQRLQKPDGTVNRTAWLRVERQVHEIQSSLRDSRQNINVALSIVNRCVPQSRTDAVMYSVAK